VGDVEAALEEYRDVREALEWAVRPLATSVDGRRFTRITEEAGADVAGWW
jgi:hypothetical protein